MINFQLSLFYDFKFLIQTSSFYRKYYYLFKSLDLSSLKDRNDNIGRTGKSRHAMLRALIVKHLERIDTIPQLLTFLDAHPMLTEMCGFNLKSLPHSSQFYRFLKNVKNSSLQNIQVSITKELISHGIVTLDTLIIDSKPIMAASRENNFKNPKRNTYDKTKQPKRNPGASLSYYSYQSVRGKKDNFIFFWGYRTHALISKEGIPLVETTLPNNSTDAKVAKKLIKKLKRLFSLKKGSIFIADAAYDQRDFYNFIVNQLQCQAFIPINPRNQKQPKIFGSHGCPLCDAKLEMKSAGSWTENLRTRLKFRCPIKTNKAIAKRYNNQCPISHPLSTSGATYGCTKYLDITDDARSRVPRDTPFFKDTYNLRTEVERYFSRLGNREAEQTTHYKLQSVKNQMTIAHLSLSLVAYASAITANHPDNIRCYRTFADQLDPLAA